MIFEIFGQRAKTDYVVYTLYNVLLRIARNLRVTRVIIKIESHPCYPKNVVFMGMTQNGRLKKTEIINSPNSHFFFAKTSGIGPWLS
jgi:hypothetical protein